MSQDHHSPCVTGCGTPADGHYLCQRCADALARTLSTVAELAEELDTSVARQTRHGEQVATTTSGPAPLPYDPGAAEAASVLRNTLTTWARDVAEHCGHTLDTEDTLADVAAWLRARTQIIRTHPAIAELVDEIGHATGHGWRVVDRRPGRVYLGTCSAETTEGACPTDLYAPADPARPGRIDPRHAVVTCPACAAQWDTSRRRAWLLDSLRGQLATAREIASAAGVIAGRDINVKTIRTWHHNGRIPALGHAPDGCPLHRIGDVVDVAAVTATRRRGAGPQTAAHA